MTSLFSMSIRFLLFLIVFIVALPAAGIIVYSGVGLRNHEIKAARLETQKLADSIAIEQQNLVAAAQQLMRILAQLPEVNSHNAAQMHTILNDIVRLNSQYLNISIADRTGTVWVTAVPTKLPFIISDRRFFINALASGQLSSGEYVISRATGKPAFNLGYPFKNEHDEIVGVISVSFNLNYYRHLLERLRLPVGTSFALFDHKGVILSRAIDDKPYIGKQDTPERFLPMRDGPDSATFVGAGLDGIKRFTSYRKLRLDGEKSPYMYIRAGIPVGIALASANKILLHNMLQFIFFLLLALYLAWIIGKRYIVDRLSLLEKASQRLADGDFQLRISGLVGGGELGRLGKSFDNMAQQLDLREQALLESEKNYRQIFNGTNDAIFVHEVDSGKIIDVNKTFQNMYGYSPEEILQETVQKISSGEPPYSQKEALKWIQKTLNEGAQSFEWLGKRKNGEIFWSEVVLSAVNIGREVRVLAAVRDITDRKRAEKEIEMLNAGLAAHASELEAANQELEAFNYTVTHDLRKPLTIINGYCQVILEIYGNNLAEECKKYLDEIYDGTLSMNQLIDALLKFSVLSRRELHRETVDFSSMANKVAEELRQIETEREVTLNIAEGITVNGDKTLMRVVMENLLGNAWKYTGKQEETVIEFGVTEMAGESAYFVRDNGPGFDMKDAKQLFAPFQRLPGADEFKGHGIGLATVARIIQRHGGRIWAESEPGKGATFYFTMQD